MTYVVMVDDHFHYMDPEERYKSGEFAHAADALAHCRRIVDDYLAATLAARPNAMTASQLWDSYTSFGEDPFIIVMPGEEPLTFSAWAYARAQCEARCGGVIPEPEKRGAKNVGL